MKSARLILGIAVFGMQTTAAMTYDWHRYNDHEYALLTPQSWASAEAVGVSVGGHLVAIAGAEEQAFLEATFLAGSGSTTAYWIGFNDRQVEGSWVWTTGENVAYTHWSPGYWGYPPEPNNWGGNEDAALLNWWYSAHGLGLGEWSDGIETDSWPAIIERPVLLGDLNCDQRIDFDDINPFVAALVSEEGYEQAHPNCRWLNGDIDGNSAVDFDDINPFVTCLVNGGCP